MEPQQSRRVLILSGVLAMVAGAVSLYLAEVAAAPTTGLRTWSWVLAGGLLLLGVAMTSFGLRSRAAQPAPSAPLPKDPYAALRHIQTTMDGLFDELFTTQAGSQRPLASSTGDGDTIQYEVPLPPGITAAQVKARVQGSVLRISVPRLQQVRPRDVPIE